MMFIPHRGAYLLAIQSDAHLWEYAYNKKVVLMSPTNLISALRLSLDLWKRENQGEKTCRPSSSAALPCTKRL